MRIVRARIRAAEGAFLDGCAPIGGRRASGRSAERGSGGAGDEVRTRDCGVDYPKLIEGEADYVLYGHTNPWDHLPGTLMVRRGRGAGVTRDGTPYAARSGAGG